MGGLSASCTELSDCDVDRDLVCEPAFGMCIDLCLGESDCTPLGGHRLRFQGLTKGICFASCTGSVQCGGNSRRARPLGVGEGCAPRRIVSPDHPEWLPRPPPPRACGAA